MKRILSVLCLLAVILSCAASAFAEGPDWASAYRAVLDEALAKRNAENPGDFLAECSYCLYDIDKDGTPELLLKTGTCEADYMGRIFFFDGRRASQLGEELSLSHSSFYTDPDEIASKIEVTGLKGQDEVTYLILDGARRDAGEYSPPAGKALLLQRRGGDCQRHPGPQRDHV